jgi:hypothetical protein
MGSDPDISQK